MEEEAQGGGGGGAGSTEAAGEGARQAAQLDSITDHVEEKQLDAERTKEAMAALSGRTKDTDREREERQRELAKVRVVQADVDILADEFEVCVIECDTHAIMYMCV